MSEYHKIQTVYMRDPATKHKTLLEGQFSLPEFEYLANNEWIFTEKVDGTNIRIICESLPDGGYNVTLGGRTDKAQIPAMLLERLSLRFLGDERQELLKNMFPKGAILYGEGYGSKIQPAGGLYRQDQDFVLFDVKVGDFWLHREAVEGIAKNLDIDFVPVVGVGTLYEMVEHARRGIKSTWGDFQAEGYVARPAVELLTRGGSRLITKIKCRDFRAG